MPTRKNRSKPGTAVAPKRPVADMGAVREESDELGEFATQLDIARIIWRKYPGLIECDEFPDQFLPAFLHRNEGLQPGTDCLFDKELVERGILTVELRENIDNSPHTLDLIALRNAVEKVKEDAPAGSDWSAKYDLGKRVLVNSFDPPRQDDNDLELLAVFQRIARENVSNYGTPVNNFICDLAFLHGIRPLTLEDVAEKFKAFEADWHEALETAHKLYREYRPLVAFGEETARKLEQEASEGNTAVENLNEAAANLDVALVRLGS